MDDKFVSATSAVDLRLSPSVSGILEEEGRHLGDVQWHLKSVLTEADGKEIQNTQLARYLREARHEASHVEDLLSELEYYRIQRELEVNGEVIAS